MDEEFRVRPAAEHEVAVVLGFIRELAEYEHLAHEVVATEDELRASLFGARRYAEVVFGCLNDVPVGFALFFHSYSTFLGRPGLYLEDLYVRPAARGRRVGLRLLAWLAQTAVERGCGRLEWAVLDWNEPAKGFYRSLGAHEKSDWRIMRVTGEALEKLARG
jgi:GNAT superfamily N-acetyltransferase